MTGAVPTRRLTVALACLLIAAVLAADVIADPPNHHAAPAIIAFGSGKAPTGGFCGAAAPPMK
ncbi:MAG: hypothetical protein Q4G49_13885 [Paracoccus sp. (in: a-proteobacteria)]|nr:hypothetical protein [Paracoccus sp. (in: a-proteobacteria)]